MPPFTAFSYLKHYSWVATLATLNYGYSFNISVLAHRSWTPKRHVCLVQSKCSINNNYRSSNHLYGVYHTEQTGKLIIPYQQNISWIIIMLEIFHMQALFSLYHSLVKQVLSFINESKEISNFFWIHNKWST